nr:transcriptional regulator [Candidatus Sigynarchaeota archaeon]
MAEVKEGHDEEETIREKLSTFLVDLKEPTGFAEIVKAMSLDQAHMHPESLIDDINHVLKSLKMKGIMFHILPATCKKCGFAFKTTKMDYKIPSKCPKCKNSLITPPMIKRKKETR